MNFFSFIFCSFLLSSLISPLVIPLAKAATEIDSVLFDHDPTGISPGPISTNDFELKWVGEPLSGVAISLVPNSLQWVRVSDVLLIPRALLSVRALSGDSGLIRVRGFNQAISRDSAQSTILVPLISGKSSGIQVEIVRDNSLIAGKIEVVFRPLEKGKQIFLDPSCSRTPLRYKAIDLPNDVWFYIGCQTTRTSVEDYARNDLDILVFSSEAEISTTNQQKIPAFEPHHWNFRLNHFSDTIEILARQGKLTLSAPLPEKSHLASVGLGVGPYQFDFVNEEKNFHSVVPLATLYGSYVLHGTNRLVLFGAFTVSKNTFSDAGAYFQFESFRGFDRRISLQLLVGLHGFAYNSPSYRIARFNYPQGFEVICYDFFGNGKNASVGGFLQPSIGGKEYYNTWLRWGSTRWFVEGNYIYTLESPGFSIRTYGITAGMPLLSFL